MINTEEKLQNKFFNVAYETISLYGINYVWQKTTWFRNRTTFELCNKTYNQRLQEIVKPLSLSTSESHQKTPRLMIQVNVS